jgi:TetR/AcrR family transcriptional repressor of lmrAB and yxaGH operons
MTNMPPRKTDSRARAISTASTLFKKQGYHGTGLTQIIKESGSPKGSFYFHFPGGKEELAVEAVSHGSQDIVMLLKQAAEQCNGDGMQFVDLATENVSGWLEGSDYENACPVTSIALEMAPHSEILAEVCANAFAEWIVISEQAFIDCGISGKRARSLATAFVSSLEGAFVLARTEKSTKTFLAVRDIFRLVMSQA